MALGWGPRREPMISGAHWMLLSTCSAFCGSGEGTGCLAPVVDDPGCSKVPPTAHKERRGVGKKPPPCCPSTLGVATWFQGQAEVSTLWDNEALHAMVEADLLCEHLCLHLSSRPASPQAMRAVPPLYGWVDVLLKAAEKTGTLKCWAAPVQSTGELRSAPPDLRRVSDLRLSWPFSLMDTDTAMGAVTLKVATLMRVEC